MTIRLAERGISGQCPSRGDLVGVIQRSTRETGEHTARPFVISVFRHLFSSFDRENFDFGAAAWRLHADFGVTLLAHQR